MIIHRNLKARHLYIKVTESDGFITALKLSKTPVDSEMAQSALLEEAEHQIKAYFSGNLASFHLPLKPEGTEFQKLVWNETLNIPFGSTLSYGELAQKCGSAGKARAVGNALGKNPVPLIIPCHRVLASQNKLGGFTGGVEIKRILLGIENILFVE